MANNQPSSGPGGSKRPQIIIGTGRRPAAPQPPAPQAAANAAPPNKPKKNWKGLALVLATVAGVGLAVTSVLKSGSDIPEAPALPPPLAPPAVRHNEALPVETTITIPSFQWHFTEEGMPVYPPRISAVIDKPLPGARAQPPAPKQGIVRIPDDGIETENNWATATLEISFTDAGGQSRVYTMELAGDWLENPGQNRNSPHTATLKK